ncbi:hypothetical protein [Staphylococcus hominis]|uniref:hypothetical protein n=1 Tax=Staphylococcus hominis TaxID=1290 RepID=UPI00287FAD5D|nr:hypothetical protein [Staphylococcus hominis]
MYKRYLDKMTTKEIENGNKEIQYHNHKLFDMNKYIMLVSFILLVVIGLLNLFLN